MTWHRTRKPVQVEFDQEKALTKQAFAEETNVNQIMAKYQATGQFTHINKNPAVYGDFSGVDTLQGALAQIDEARSIFMALPAEVRKDFNNDLSAFVRYSQEASAEDLLAKGIIVADPQQSDQGSAPDAQPPAAPPAEASTPADTPSEQPPS